MGNSRQSTGRKLEGFLRNLSELVENLPSRETKSRLDQELEALIMFLQDFQTRLRLLPTGEDRDGIASTIETLRDYVHVAESDPVMSRVLGLSKDDSMLKKSSRNMLSEQDRKEAKAVAEELKRLSPGDVERRLADKDKYPVPMLRRIGGELGLNFPSKATRLSIVDKITRKTVNLRGYDYLRHGYNKSIGGVVSEARGEPGQHELTQEEEVVDPYHAPSRASSES